MNADQRIDLGLIAAGAVVGWVVPDGAERLVRSNTRHDELLDATLVTALGRTS